MGRIVVCNRCGEPVLPIRKVQFSLEGPTEKFQQGFAICEVCFEIGLIFMNGTPLENEKEMRAKIMACFKEDRERDANMHSSSSERFLEHNSKIESYQKSPKVQRRETL